jgi:hypothetical protein
MEVDNRVEATSKEQTGGLSPARHGQYFIKVRIPVEALRKSTFHENGHAKPRELALESANRTCQQYAVSHRTETDEQDARLGWKAL